ncbi:RbsD/FucU family protein [Rathayibacter sp. SD072]|uniref:RbsD/FucU family protein n=1 Tax=Rathayibacter sp. SD072 TaxID=2781731 RepID=UPI001A96B58E|nr:RbsD/FucU domain-containing protein [Rathayibacter sp. SD072]MBO0985512.1 fucose-binding protein [Rathayibacter sp. SD072]
MLKGIDSVLTAEMLHVLMSMGHGDDLLVCDVNHPAASLAAHTTHGSVVDLAGCDLERAITAVLTLMPLDTFVPEPVQRMTVVGDEGRLMPVHERIQRVVDRAEGRAVGIGALDRFAFYDAGRRAFAVVRTSDPGPYGCFLLRMGTV